VHYYTFREELGTKRRPQPILVSTSHDLDECLERAKKRLCEEYAGAWEIEFNNCYTGTLAFLSACSPWTEPELLDALPNNVASGTSVQG